MCIGTFPIFFVVSFELFVAILFSIFAGISFISENYMKYMFFRLHPPLSLSIRSRHTPTVYKAQAY